MYLTLKKIEVIILKSLLQAFFLDYVACDCECNGWGGDFITSRNESSTTGVQKPKSETTLVTGCWMYY